MGSFPSVSAIIPTKNRANDLLAVVRSLFQQTHLPKQVVIIDQSESEESRVQVEKAFSEGTPPIREKVQFCYVLDSTISGLTAARNRAMEVAEGDVWLFLDDDVILEPDFIDELLQVYVRKPKAVGVSGVVTNYSLPPRAFRLWSWLFARGPFRDERQRVYWEAEHLRNSEPIRVSHLGGGLMSFRAEAIRGLRFDDNLRGVSDGEDVDFCARLGRNAILMITPRARLLHRQSPAGREQGHQLRREARAKHYLYYRNWHYGFRNRLCFFWLNVGYGLAAMVASLRRGSLEPWNALVAGASEGKNAIGTVRGSRG